MKKRFWLFSAAVVLLTLFWVLFYEVLIKRESSSYLRSGAQSIFPQNVSKDWWYAFYWSPDSLIPSFPRVNFRDDFSEIKAVVSKKKIMTPSGTPVYVLQRTRSLRKLFTYNPNHLIYLFVSSSLKAFCGRSEIGGKKIDGVPAAWFTLKFAQVKKPGLLLTLIIPKKLLQKLIVKNWKPILQEKKGWLSVQNPEIQSDQASVEKGKEVYTQYCAACHGIYGNGGGSLSVFLFPKPRDFRSGEFMFKTTFETERPLTLDLYRTISNGLFGTSMPSFRFLNPLERWDAAKYIEGFAVNPQTGKKLFSSPTPVQVLKIHEPQFSKNSLMAAIQEGRKLFYGTAGCSSCHGPGVDSVDGLPHGDGSSSAASIDDWGYPVKPANLAGGFLKRGNSPREIYATISTGLSGTSMPTYDSILSQQQRWALAFYVSKLNKTFLRRPSSHSSAFQKKLFQSLRDPQWKRFSQK
jgi:mono/diheme cytochrome c family protein